jgi:hypothetical protein
MSGQVITNHSWQLAAVSWQQMQTAHCKLQTLGVESRFMRSKPWRDH